MNDANNNVIGIAIVAADGTWSITPTSSLIDGTYNFWAEYTSISGVTGPASAPITVVIDTVAPSAPAAPTISDQPKRLCWAHQFHPARLHRWHLPAR